MDEGKKLVARLHPRILAAMTPAEREEVEKEAQDHIDRGLVVTWVAGADNTQEDPSWWWFLSKRSLPDDREAT